MRAAGIRELKAKLSEYIRYVQAGESVMVTEHGKVVAELRLPRQFAPDQDAGLEELARQGLLTLGSAVAPAANTSMSALGPPGTAARLLDEGRGRR